MKTFELFKKIVTRILNGDIPKSTPQTAGTYYGLKDLERGKYIGEHESAETIERKIRAYWNPPYSGAKIILNGHEYTLINDQILRYIAAHTAPWSERYINTPPPTASD